VSRLSIWEPMVAKQGLPLSAGNIRAKEISFFEKKSEQTEVINQMRDKKGSVSTGGIIAIMIVGILLVGGVILGLIRFSRQSAVDTVEKIVETKAVNALTTAKLQFQFDAYDGSNAQNNESDLDFDILYWDSSKNGELKKEGYLDCSKATPIRLDLKASNNKKVFSLPDSAFCDINVYKMTQAFTVGNTESNFQEYLSLKQADITSSQGSYDTRTTNAIETGQVFLVTMGEKARSTQEDVVPKAFLIEIGNETSLDAETKSKIEAGDIPLVLKYRYNSFAGNHSKITLDGECEDSESSTPETQLDASWNGAISSSLTTETVIDLRCTLKAEINKNGYEEPLYNPLADGNSEKPYMIVYPFMEGRGYDNMVEYGRTNITGEIGYNAGNTNATAFIWSNFEVCGETITDSSTTDARKKAAEKVYDPDCFPKTWMNENDAWTFDVKVDDIACDYDAVKAAAGEDLGNDEVMTGAGGTAESFGTIEIFGLLHLNPVINQTITG